MEKMFENVPNHQPADDAQNQSSNGVDWCLDTQVASP